MRISKSMVVSCLAVVLSALSLATAAPIPTLIVDGRQNRTHTITFCGKRNVCEQFTSSTVVSRPLP